MNSVNFMNNKLALLAVVVALSSLTACEGRDPLITQMNADAVIEPPPPPPPPEVRTLTTRKLFGALPVDNRFQDPLMTFTGTGWFAFADSFRDYPLVNRVVDVASPTQTPYLKIDPAQQQSPAVLLGQLKTARAPLHVEVWIGRDGEVESSAFRTVDASLAGLFAGVGENIAPLAALGEPVVVEGRTWQRFAVDVSEGPVGWSYLMVGDTAQDATLYVGGPAAVDVEASPNSALVFSTKKRALTVKERALVDAVQERTRTLGAPKLAKDAALPGVPGVAPSAPQR